MNGDPVGLDLGIPDQQIILLSLNNSTHVWCRPNALSNRERGYLVAMEYRKVLWRCRKTLPCTYPVKAWFLLVPATSQDLIGLNQVYRAQPAPSDFSLLGLTSYSSM